jgi:hypothetical protein
MLTGAGNFIRFYFRQRYYRLRAKGKYAAFGKNISGFSEKIFFGNSCEKRAFENENTQIFFCFL